MSSVFIAFCFIKTVSGNSKFLNGTAVYRVSNDEDEFRELNYKGFTRNSDTLIVDFERNSIVLMIGRYVYHQNAEYLSLIQTIPLSSPQTDSDCVPEDLPYTFPLMIYFAPAITNSYKCKKGIESDVIMFYTNANGRYDSLKEGLKKSVILAIGRLKINTNSKIPHIISLEIEWSYAANESSSSIQSSPEKRQRDDLEFYNILQKIRVGKLSDTSISIIRLKVNANNNLIQFYNTTHIVEIRHEAQNINNLLCTYLPFDHEDLEPNLSNP
ncbi:hypothetical protein C2G38_2216364 [Gigaspora rosea]|uniref:Uncharacterized protein n=1 Tax=Gigaspora rosea TaxID=44941 RepID=A0A397U974_9GLOM|nr:hypothetical protein C2G38_2216364 [Gigaspora rosea]